MSQHNHVPKFGNWESDGNIPYTQYFEKAHKGRSGEKTMNPNDPCDNPKELHASREDNIRQWGGSPLHDSVAYKCTSGSPHHVYGDQMTSGNYQRRAGRVSDKSEYGVNHSPLHPNYQMKVSVYPSFDGLSGGSHAITSNSAGTLRMTGVQDDKVIKKASALPKFGEWDESNPDTADNYSRIFNKVREGKQKEEKQREEEQTGSAKVPDVSSDKAYVNSHESSHESSGCWCFTHGWCKK